VIFAIFDKVSFDILTPSQKHVFRLTLIARNDLNFNSVRFFNLYLSNGIVQWILPTALRLIFIANVKKEIIQN